jgi:hypothetical protein
MPLDRRRYPPDWLAISKRIRERSGGRCECAGECGLHAGRRCAETNHTAAKFANGKVVLTVAHLNHDPQDCRDGNLKALCQRCHLRYDAALHARRARATRLRKSGQQGLFRQEARE